MAFGDGDSLLTTSRGNIDHQYNTSGTFEVLLVAFNNAGCSDTAVAEVTAIIVPKLDLPNAFTPQSNSLNSIIFVRGFGIGKMKWRIYNRVGNLVFESNSQLRLDGMANTKACCNRWMCMHIRLK